MPALLAMCGPENLHVPLSQVLMSTLYVTLWITLSGTVILYNKWILAFYGFPYPITLTMWHMLFSGVRALVVTPPLHCLQLPCSRAHSNHACCPLWSWTPGCSRLMIR